MNLAFIFVSSDYVVGEARFKFENDESEEKKWPNEKPRLFAFTFGNSN